MRRCFDRLLDVAGSDEGLLPGIHLQHLSATSLRSSADFFFDFWCDEKMMKMDRHGGGQVWRRRCADRSAGARIGSGARKFTHNPPVCLCFRGCLHAISRLPVISKPVLRDCLWFLTAAAGNPASGGPAPRSPAAAGAHHKERPAAPWCDVSLFFAHFLSFPLSFPSHVSAFHAALTFSLTFSQFFTFFRCFSLSVAH